MKRGKRIAKRDFKISAIMFLIAAAYLAAIALISLAR